MLIIDMPMPEDCVYCPMSHWNKLDEFTGCEVAAGKLFAATRDKEYANSVGRPDWCPIKGELPDEHGDLIDRDELKVMKVYSHERHEYIVPVSYIDWEQAVIAAERKDDERTAD